MEVSKKRKNVDALMSKSDIRVESSKWKEKKKISK